MAKAPEPVAFASAASFRAWLRAHHRDTPVLVLRLYKKHASHRGLTHLEALQEALCYGWIDGVLHALDEDSFSVRFTPRRKTSRWSAVNVRRAKKLIEERRMRAPGLAAFEARTADSAGSSFETRDVELAPAFERRFRENAAAWSWFQAKPPSYRRLAVFWVMEAKREETRERRLASLIDAAARQVSVPPLRMLDRKTRSAGE